VGGGKRKGRKKNALIDDVSLNLVVFAGGNKEKRKGTEGGREGKEKNSQHRSFLNTVCTLAGPREEGGFAKFKREGRRKRGGAARSLLFLPLGNNKRGNPPTHLSHRCSQGGKGKKKKRKRKKRGGGERGGFEFLPLFYQ